jgi:hemerythrin-like domain-containing protein
MNIDVFTTLSQEHEALLPLILDIQSAAEAADIPALVEKLIAGRQALTIELDAHIALEDDGAFISIEEALGKEVVLPFRAEHSEIRALRDRILAEIDAGCVSIDLCLQFCDLLQAHMQREDAMLFPSTRTALVPGTPVTSPHRESGDGMDHPPSPQVFWFRRYWLCRRKCGGSGRCGK